MAHYDCSNCGATLGIAFGICEKCTPKEYLSLKKECEERRQEIRRKMETMIRERADRIADKELESKIHRMKEIRSEASKYV